MGIITSMRRQTAVYWAPLTNPAGDPLHTKQGQRRYDDPVQIKCRWENTTEQFVDANGEKQMSKAKVYVDRDVLVGGLLRLGTLASLEFQANPRENDNVLEIKSFEKMPNLRASEFLRTVML